MNVTRPKKCVGVQGPEVIEESIVPDNKSDVPVKRYTPLSQGLVKFKVTLLPVTVPVMIGSAEQSVPENGSMV